MLNTIHSMYIECIFSVPPQLQILTMTSGSDSDILGPVLSPYPTYQELMVYHCEVLKFPGPINQWLTANSQSPQISFLCDYLMIDDVQKNCERIQLIGMVPSSLIHIFYTLPHVGLGTGMKNLQCFKMVNMCTGISWYIILRQAWIFTYFTSIFYHILPVLSQFVYMCHTV